MKGFSPFFVGMQISFAIVYCQCFDVPCGGATVHTGRETYALTDLFPQEECCSLGFIVAETDYEKIRSMVLRVCMSVKPRRFCPCQ